jgi:dolichyl-phosphate-mannose--protein O-mannosyl transferase
MTRVSRDWTLALSLTLIAFIQRVWGLGYPKGFIFDEVYYAKNAYSLSHHGVEIDLQKHTAEFVVHPPVGKWLIAIGIKLFGYNEFGWRISAAVIGSLSITLIYFTAKKLFNTEFLSIAAAFLIMVDGLHLVHSRVALLDIFLMFFIQIALLAILYGKYWITGFALGLACATKWSGLYFTVAMALLVLAIDWLRHRYFGEEQPNLEVIAEDIPKRFLQFIGVPLVTYIATWTGWFITKTGWDRNYSTNIFKSLWHYHYEILNFHENLTEIHPYMANPWSWLIMGRPTSFYYQTPNGCGASKCSQEVLALGTPFLYWSIAIALLIVIGYWLVKREFVAGVLLTVVAGGYLPWFLIQKRTMFTFYVISFEPFLILLLVYLLYLYLNGAKDEAALKNRKSIALCIGAIYLVNFLYFLPLYYGTNISYNSWLDHMWLNSWI